MKNIFTLFIWLILLVASPGHAMSRLAEKRGQPLGVRTLEYLDEKREFPVLVELWYPTKEEGPFESSSDSIWIHPQEIRNSSFSSTDKPYPLIVLSHGNRGDRRDRSWLAAYLVNHGFIVASVEHYGNTLKSYNPLISLQFWNRARDVICALDHLLADSELKEWIDPERIGFAGYSLGGMTGLALAGAVPQNVKEILSLQVGKIPEITPEVLEKLDFSEGYVSYFDSRIKAFLLICPGIFIYPPTSLQKINVPVALIASLHDEVLPHKEHAYQIIQHVVPAKLKIMKKKISHFAFLNRVTREGKATIEEALLYDPSKKTDPIHDEVGRFAVDFFNAQMPVKRHTE